MPEHTTKKLVLLIGSGATRAQAPKRCPITKLPPLDNGFFSQIRAPISKDVRLVRIKSYLSRTYKYDPRVQGLDSFETIASILYADAYAPATQGQAYPILLDLITFLSSRIASTVNPLRPNSYNLLQRILYGIITDLGPENVSIITFNYDLQIERALRRAGSRVGSSPGSILSFPGCYRMQNTANAVRSVTGASRFMSTATLNHRHDGIPVLKLHGSLNWVSGYKSQIPAQNQFFSPRKRTIYITNVDQVTNWPVRIPTRAPGRLFGYPRLVPPVPHKSVLFHDEIKDIWSEAHKALSDADELLVFGYSCPFSDQEAANLIRSTSGVGRKLKRVMIVDPKSSVVDRYASLTDAKSIYWYHDAREFIYRKPWQLDS